MEKDDPSLPNSKDIKNNPNNDQQLDDSLVNSPQETEITGDNPKASRKRGIIASRAKLNKAMVSAGFSKRVDLARAIALQEGSDIENPPTPMVNKVFRGQSVQDTTIERIAIVLKVEAHSLFETQEEKEIRETPKQTSDLSITPTVEQSNPESRAALENNIKLGKKDEHLYKDKKTPDEANPNPPEKTGKSSRFLFAALILIFVLGGASILFGSQNKAEPLTITRAFENDIKLIAMVGAQSLPFDNFANDIAHRLGNNIEVKDSQIEQLGKAVEPWSLSKDLNVDLVISITVNTLGRFDAVFIHAYSETQKKLLFADVFSNTSLVDYQQEIVANTSNVLLNLIENASSLPAHQANNIEAVLALQEGLTMFDQPSETGYLSLAMTGFYRAINIEPSYLQAQAALCHGLAALFRVKSEDNLLSQAEFQCNKISESAQASPRFQAAMGYLERVKKNPEKAEGFYKKSLELSPNSVDAMLGLAETYLALMNVKRDASFLNKGIELADVAIKIAPDFWKSTFVKGRLYYFSGQPELALIETTKSSEINANYSNLSNIASINFCFGDPNISKQKYEEIASLQFAPPITHYNLGSIYGYFEDYSSAAKSMDFYLQLLAQENSSPSLDGYIGIADTFRLDGQLQNARELYIKAYTQAEKLRLSGDENPSLVFKLLYIDMVFAMYNDTALTTGQKEGFKEQLDSFNEAIVDPNSRLQLLYAFMMIDDYDSAGKIYQELAPMCKGFSNAPGLDVFDKADEELL